MSEKVFAFLLRLYPSHFRETYGEEALQLFRDRARDEKGFFAAVRLWFDLLADFAVSLPREYFQVDLALTSAKAWQRVAGVPSFVILEDKYPSAVDFFGGTLASMFVVAVISVSLNQAVRQSSGMGQRSAQSGLSQRRSGGPSSGDSGNSAPAAAPDSRQSGALDEPQRHRVIDAAATNLKQHYVDAGVAQGVAQALLEHERNGDDAVSDGAVFAGLLTKQMRDASQDAHLVLIYSDSPLPERALAQSGEPSAEYRHAMEQQNCTFEKVEVLPNGIGYLKLNSFPDPAVCRGTATTAMAILNRSNAIIFDLRDNKGGFPDMVSLMASYLFDHPEYLYNPRENTTVQSWTRSPVSGSKLADKPVFILTSSRTASGAEQFCYNLKMLKRATLIGETTAGSAHSGVFHRIDDHFGMGIPEVRTINPYAKADWEGTGVEPDVKVNAADALETAKKLAASKLRKP
jgi:hypothetical protein